MTIVSHLPPRHLDDFLAITIVRKVYPSAELKFVHPQSPEIASLRSDGNSILIDVGEDYNPELNNFDHHHDKDLPCSLILVAENLLSGKEKDLILSHPAVKVIDFIDRFGLQKAIATLGIKPSEEIDEKRKTILLLDLEKHEIFSFFVDALLNTGDYDSFVSWLYDRLDEAGLLSEPKSRLEEEEKKFNRILSEAITITVKGVRVLYSKESFAPEHYKVFSLTKADLLIEKNKMEPRHTSVIKNSASPLYEKIDLSRLSLLYEKVFLHRTGFMIVLNVPVEEVDVVKVLEVLFSEL